MTEHVKTELLDGVLVLTLQRPDKKNALTGAMYNALSDALDRAETDASIKVVLFQGDGDSFTAGNDLADFAAQSKSNSDEDSPASRFIETIGKATKPLVAAVQGNAVGIGTTMLLHCDLVYLAEGARLITPFVNLALVPEADGRRERGCDGACQCRCPSSGVAEQGDGCRHKADPASGRLVERDQAADA
jgi:enoyl-CoA hydratase/carnithine racemase